MFTVTMSRSFSILSVAAAVAVSSAHASAQVIISSDGSREIRTNVSSLVSREVTISDDSVRSYLTRFEPGVLDDESGDANMVTMVLDNDGAYIRSNARHAKVIQAVPGRVISVNGDSVQAIETGAGRVIAINRDSVRALTTIGAGEVRVIATGGSVIAVNGLHRVDGSGSPGLIAGLSPDEVGGIATKHYPAGAMGKGPVFVTFIYLK